MFYHFKSWSFLLLFICQECDKLFFLLLVGISGYTYKILWHLYWLGPNELQQIYINTCGEKKKIIYIKQKYSQT